jgi:hypothetical protein
MVNLNLIKKSTKDEIRSLIIGKWTLGGIDSPLGYYVYNFDRNGHFSRIVRFNNIPCKVAFGFTGASGMFKGNWYLEDKTTVRVPIRYVRSVGPAALLGTVLANVIGTDYGGTLSYIDHGKMILNDSEFQRLL